MKQSALVISIGAVCFGLVVGYITYRTLARSTEGAAVSDLAAVIAAIGGGTVTALFQPDQSDAFGWYSMGLLLGMASYLVASLLIRGKRDTAQVMGDGDLRPPTARQEETSSERLVPPTARG
jgi:hypothetical protein